MVGDYIMILVFIKIMHWVKKGNPDNRINGINAFITSIFLNIENVAGLLLTPINLEHHWVLVFSYTSQKV
jgi:hypothetical protein